MYRVLLDGIPIMNPPRSLLIENPTLTLTDNEAGSFTFKIYPDNPGYQKVSILQSIASVYWDDELLFTGRVIAAEKDFYRGLKVECEGDLALLDDTVMPAATMNPVPVETALASILVVHDMLCDESRQFQLGEVTVTGNVGFETNWESPLQVIKDQIIGQLGGHLRVREEGGVRYLDYLADYPRTSNQTIEFGENLLDYVERLDGRDLVTVVYPYGKDGLDIGAVSTTKFITESSLVPLYGRIFKAVEFNDIEDPQELYDTAIQWLHANCFDKLSLTLTAVDLADLGLSADHFRHLDKVKCYSSAHNLNREFPITELSINLLDASQNVYTLGFNTEEFTRVVHQTTQKVEQVTGGGGSSSGGGSGGSGGKNYDADIKALKDKNSDQDDDIKALQDSDSEQSSALEDLQTSQGEQNRVLNALMTKDTQQDDRLAALEARPSGGGEMGSTGHVWIQPSLQQPDEFYITEGDSLAQPGNAFKWNAGGLYHGTAGYYETLPMIDKSGFVNLTGNIQCFGDNTSYSLNSGVIVSNGPSTMTIQGGALSSYRVNTDTSAAFVNDSVIASDYWKGNSAANIRTHMEIGDGKITGFADVQGRFITGASNRYGYMQFSPFDDTYQNKNIQSCGLTINGETLNLQVDNLRICESRTSSNFVYGLTTSITVGSGYFGYLGGKIVQYPITLHFNKGILRQVDFGGSLETWLAPTRKIRGFDAGTLTLWEDS